MKVELHLSNYVTKADLKSAGDFDTLDIAKKQQQKNKTTTTTTTDLAKK